MHAAIGGGFSRYFLFCGTPILLWASLALYHSADFLRKRLSEKTFYKVIFLLLLILFSPAVIFNYKLLTNPIEAPLTGGDYDTHIRSQHSGYGISEAIDYFKGVSRNKKITIFTSYNWGNPADSIYVYLSDDPNINVYTAFWAFDQKLLPPGFEMINTLIINTMQKFTGKKINIYVSSRSDVYFICRSPAISKGVFLGANKDFQLVRSFRKPSSTVFIDIYKRTD